MVKVSALCSLSGWVFAVCAAAAQPQVAPASQTGTYKISGTVTWHLTGLPVKHARVAIIMNRHPEREASLWTADDGRFIFTDVPPGKYTLQAEYYGQLQRYEQDDEQFSTGIVTGPGLDSEHISFALQAATSLSVDVLDDENQPVRTGANVFLIRRHVSAGWAQLRLESQIGTDSRGVAHFAHLQPGTYYVAVTGRPWYSQSFAAAQPGMKAENAAQLNVAYPITYYGGTQDPNASVPLQIAEGERSHVQIALQAVPAAKVRLAGMAGYAGSMPVGEQVNTTLEAVGPGGIRIPTESQSFEANGERELIGFAPGNYVVSTSVLKPVEGAHGIEGVEQRTLGSAHLTSNAAVLNASELIRTSVSGQIRLESGSAIGLFVLLINPRTRESVTCSVLEKGLFTCGGQENGSVPQGWYEIRLGRAALYPKSIEVTGGRYLSGLLEVREGASIKLSITAAQGLTDVDGIVVDNGSPRSGAMVLLVPDDLSVRRDYSRDQSDSDGTFTLPRVQPGRYFLIAIDHGSGLEYHNRQSLAPYLARAQTVEIPLRQGITSVRVDVQKR